MTEYMAGGTPRPRMTAEAFKTHVKADLRQSVWEAAQVMPGDAIADFVDGVLREIADDAE
jgi:hypothetical protein